MVKKLTYVHAWAERPGIQLSDAGVFVRWYPFPASRSRRNTGRAREAENL